MRWPASDRRVTKRLLIRRAGAYGIHMPSRWRRQTMCDHLNEYEACRMIQRAYRTRSMCNSVCPITLEELPLDRSKSFCFVTSDSRRVGYDAHALASYIDTSGDIRDPLTRECYSDNDLRRLERQTGRRLRVRPTELLIDVVIDPAEEIPSTTIYNASQQLIDDVRRIITMVGAGQMGADEFVRYLFIQFTPAVQIMNDLLRPAPQSQRDFLEALTQLVDSAETEHVSDDERWCLQTLGVVAQLVSQH
jgi:hypothetical protein